MSIRVKESSLLSWPDGHCCCCKAPYSRLNCLFTFSRPFYILPCLRGLLDISGIEVNTSIWSGINYRKNRLYMSFFFKKNFPMPKTQIYIYIYTLNVIFNKKKNIRLLQRHSFSFFFFLTVITWNHQNLMLNCQ